MNNNGSATSKPRSDPFGLGLTAQRDSLPRDSCPFPATYVEARRWLAGWDHGELAHKAARVRQPSELRASPRERPWSRGELVVLTTLVRSGEALSSLAFRLRRTKGAIRDRCTLQKLDMTEAQEGS